jgi:transposase
MNIENIDVKNSIDNARKQISEDKTLSLGMKSTVELLILIITLLVNRLGVKERELNKGPIYGFAT